MKRHLLILFLLAASAIVWGQVPYKMSYQAIIRNNQNTLVQSQAVSVRIGILQGGPNGRTVYSEQHQDSTNVNGMVTLIIGSGTVLSGSFEKIPWEEGPFFLKTETDPSGGNAFSITGITELLSVPYAFQAEKAGSFSDGKEIGNILYWDGAQWKFLPPGLPGQGLFLSENGLPVWAGPTFASVITLSVTDLSYNSAVLNGTLASSGGGTVQKGFVWSESSNPTIEDRSEVVAGIKDSFSLAISGLKPGTKYFGRAFAENRAGIVYGNEISFTTYTISPPVLSTIPPTHVTRTAASSGGNITDNGGLEISERGVCWSTSPLPAINDHKIVSSGNNLGSYVTELTGLPPATRIYIRAYATNLSGTGYGNEFSFTTESYSLPFVQTISVFDITRTSAEASGAILDDGGTTILIRGLCWSTSPNPTRDGLNISLGAGVGNFQGTIKELSPGTTYYLRGFAANLQGTGYGNELVFKTDSVSLPTVLTVAVSDVTFTAATAYGTAEEDGGLPILKKGFCWGLTSKPTLSDSKVELGPGKGDFEATFSGLNPGRSYATNTLGTAYGNEIEFTTDSVSLPTVLTLSMTDISHRSAKGHGRIVDDGGSAIQNKGFCWGTDPSPTIAGAKAEEGPGGVDFESSITGLAPSTSYYLRSFATNANGTAYGNEITFVTLSISIPSLSTLSVSKVGADCAVVNGRIYSDGGDSITSRGFCWGTTSKPTTEGNKLESGKGVGDFSGTIKGLSPGTNYFLRSYASNSAGTAYGNEITFTTVNITPPVIGSLSMSSVGSSRAWGNSTVSSDGGTQVTSRGICYGQSPNPTVDGSKILLGSGTGNFGGAIKGLIPGRKYYLRSFAINSKGISYSTEIAVTTPALLSDIDGNVYNTTTIGNQTWMAESLRTTRYKNGDPVINLANATDWKNSTSGAWAYYENNSSYNIPYGKLYNWYAAVDQRNICPEGWHVSTSPDWHTMFLSLGAKEPFIYYRDILAPKIRIEGTEYWGVINKDATNESGLSGLPGGWRNVDGSFDFLLNRTWFWTATEYNITSSYGIDLQPEHLIGEGPMSKIFGLYVRCVKN